MPENYFTSPRAPSFIPQGRGESAVQRSEVDINNQQETIVIDRKGWIENMGESTDQTSGTNTIRFRILQENNEKGAEGNSPPNPYISLRNIAEKQKSSIYHRHIEHFFAFFAGNTVFSLVSESPR